MFLFVLLLSSSSSSSPPSSSPPSLSSLRSTYEISSRPGLTVSISISGDALDICNRHLLGSSRPSYISAPIRADPCSLEWGPVDPPLCRICSRVPCTHVQYIRLELQHSSFEGLGLGL
ncbi:hypothetical protein F4815DRAFT_94985 [Daldinia loculata]|nr:hypothetical protein F4815DRAFT_94985 [Daldinia loculata]